MYAYPIKEIVSALNKSVRRINLGLVDVFWYYPNQEGLMFEVLLLLYRSL